MVSYPLKINVSIIKSKFECNYFNYTIIIMLKKVIDMYKIILFYTNCKFNILLYIYIKTIVKIIFTKK